MRTLDIVACLVLALAAVVLTACGGTPAMETAEATSTSGTGDAVGAVGEGELDGAQATATSADTSKADTAPELEADYEGALDEASQLALGTLLLEETDQPLTPEQAG